MNNELVSLKPKNISFEQASGLPLTGLTAMKRVLGNMYNPVIYFAINYGNMKQVKVEAKRIVKLKSELFENNHE